VNGFAQTSAAITIANALPTGVGCAAGIELHVAARVSLTAEGSSDLPTLEIPSSSHSPLVEESLRTGLARFFPRERVVARLSLQSEVPIGRGLKSSSAVSTAILLAVARAAGGRPTPLEIGVLSAEVGKRSGVSATGALDDALAGLEPGFVVTDNLRGEVLRRSEVDRSWGVALYIPPTQHPPASNLMSTFSAERSSGELVAGAARRGDWVSAMRFNTELVEKAMGYSYGEIRDRLGALGAIASGVSGLGPALAVIAPTDRLADLLRVFPSDAAQKLVVPFLRTPAIGGNDR
jgi:shikimate kinase